MTPTKVYSLHYRLQAYKLQCCVLKLFDDNSRKSENVHFHVSFIILHSDAQSSNWTNNNSSTCQTRIDEAQSLITGALSLR